MESGASGHFEVLLSSGIRVERLPLGFAAKHWWMTIVLSSPVRWLNDWSPGPLRVHEALEATVQLTGPNGSFSALSSSAGGDNYRYGDGEVLHAVYELQPIDWVDVVYRDGGAIIAEERLVLSGDR